jgi:hypothetical protein
MRDVSDLRSTIIPKSDQLNAEQLLTGPMTITVTDVRIGAGDEQPVVVHYQGDDGRPFKPCKTMRKLLVFAWGEDGREWAGKSMTLYCDPKVKFGGEEVGGIRISHMSHIDRRVQVSLTATKGKKALYVVDRLEPPAPKQRTERHESMVADLELVAKEQGEKAFKRAWNALTEEDREVIGVPERDRLLALGRTHDAKTTTQETT